MNTSPSSNQKKKDKQHSVCYRKAPFPAKHFSPGILLTIGVYYIVRDTTIFFYIFIFLKGRWGAKGWVWCVYDSYYVEWGNCANANIKSFLFLSFLPSSERRGAVYACNYSSYHLRMGIISIRNVAFPREPFFVIQQFLIMAIYYI